ncbi:MAG: N-acetyltransferase [Dehalococcoidia bacterium]|nr:N-acetyltransferase [Dehalococcoidia bacterium]
MRVEKAKIGDASQMHRLINRFAAQGEMLPRALSEIYENIRDYFVVRNGEEVIACVALHVSWSDLAEIKSLAVADGCKERGIGTLLVKTCIDEAMELGISTIFCLTYKPAFFEKCGFELVDKTMLPRKVWGECYKCPKFPDCDEVPLVVHLGPARSLIDENDAGTNNTH